MSLARLEQIVAKANEAGRPVSTAAAAFTLGFAAGKRFLQQKKLLRLQCRPQNYAWGRVGRNSKVARLMAADGLPVDESLPYAEYWFGTHAAAPSAVVLGKDRTQLLSEWLVQNPSALGRLQPVASRTGQLPFLFKVLSVAKALSIQAHPDKRLAENLHAARPDVYKDDNHKPEMAVALTQFEAMCGFRPLAQIAAHMTTEFPEFGTLIGSDRVTEFVASIEQSPDKQQAALKAAFTAWMKCDAANRDAQLAAMLTRLEQKGDAQTPLDKLILRLSQQYPGDVGIFAPIILNYVVLEPGQAIFLAANEPHAYLSGDIVECMACSNNVVRAGLTPKLRDVDTLCEMLTYKTFDPKDLLVKPEVRGHTVSYVPPIDEFVITRIDLKPGQSEVLAAQSSPSIVLVTEGAPLLAGTPTTAGATYLERADPSGSHPIEVAAGDRDAQVYRVFAKDSF